MECIKGEKKMEIEGTKFKTACLIFQTKDVPFVKEMYLEMLLNLKEQGYRKNGF